MANTKSAKKNVRSSAKKKLHNNMWKRRFKSAVKSVSKAVLNKDDENIVVEKFRALQKSLDKASKEKVIHKNKANRVKSRYAKKISAQILGGSGKTDERKSKSDSKPERKSKAKSK